MIGTDEVIHGLNLTDVVSEALQYKQSEDEAKS